MASESTDGQPFVMCWESISCDVGGYAAIIEWFLQISTWHSSVYLTGNVYDKMMTTASQMAKCDLFYIARVKLPKDAPIEFRVPIATKLVQLTVHSAAKLAERAFAMLIEICNVLEALEWSDATDRKYYEYKSNSQESCISRGHYICQSLGQRHEMYTVPDRGYDQDHVRQGSSREESFSGSRALSTGRRIV